MLDGEDGSCRVVDAETGRNQSTHHAPRDVDRHAERDDYNAAWMIIVRSAAASNEIGYANRWKPLWRTGPPIREAASPCRTASANSGKIASAAAR